MYTPIIYIGFLQDSHGKIISLCSVSYMVSLDCLFHDLGWLSLLKALLLVFFFCQCWPCLLFVLLMKTGLVSEETFCSLLFYYSCAVDNFKLILIVKK